MPARILLNLSVPRAAFAVFAGGRLRNFTAQTNDAAAQAALAGLLAAHPHRPVYIMLDVVEEDFRQEALPHVWGRARREMVQRKLAQFFRTTPYRAACLQGRIAGRRRDDRYLFVALTNADLLKPWLHLINGQGTPVAGVYLQPSVSQTLVQKLGGKGAILLVSVQGGGLRQSLFVDGHLVISRLTPLEEATPQDLETFLPAEMEKSRLFLYNSRLVSRDVLLTAWVLDPADKLAEACRRVAAEANFRCERVTAEMLAPALGLPPAGVPRDTDTLMLYLLGRQAPECNLAPPAQRRGYVEQRLRQGLYATAGGIALAGLAWGGFLFLERHLLLEETQRVEREAAALAQRYAAATQSFPAAPASAQEMRAAVEAVGLLRAQARPPAAALRLVGGVLAAHPWVVLTRLTWKLPADHPAPGEELELAAEIDRFDGDYRAAFALIQRLREDFAVQPGVNAVRIVALPVDLDPATPLAGNTGETPATARARFKLALTLRGER